MPRRAKGVMAVQLLQDWTWLRSRPHTKSCAEEQAMINLAIAALKGAFKRYMRGVPPVSSFLV